MREEGGGRAEMGEWMGGGLGAGKEGPSITFHPNRLAPPPPTQGQSETLISACGRGWLDSTRRVLPAELQGVGVGVGVSEFLEASPAVRDRPARGKHPDWTGAAQGLRVWWSLSGLPGG